MIILERIIKDVLKFRVTCDYSGCNAEAWFLQRKAFSDDEYFACSESFSRWKLHPKTHPNPKRKNKVVEFTCFCPEHAKEIKED